MILKSLLAETLSSKYGLKNYLIKENFDDSVDEIIIIESIKIIEAEINKQNGKHEAVTHYVDKYDFVPPFVLIKILTFGELSKLYAMLKQSDRQSISKYFGLSDKVLKQVIINMTMIRNICAHNDRLFSFHSKFRISFKYFQNDYNVKSVNIYFSGHWAVLFIIHLRYCSADSPTGPCMCWEESVLCFSISRGRVWAGRSLSGNRHYGARYL